MASSSLCTTRYYISDTRDTCRENAGCRSFRLPLSLFIALVRSRSLRRTNAHLVKRASIYNVQCTSPTIRILRRVSLSHFLRFSRLSRVLPPSAPFPLALALRRFAHPRSTRQNPSPRPGVEERATGNAAGKRSAREKRRRETRGSLLTGVRTRVQSSRACTCADRGCRSVGLYPTPPTRARPRQPRRSRIFPPRTFPRLSTSVAHARSDKSADVACGRLVTAPADLNFLRTSVVTRNEATTSHPRTTRTRDSGLVRCSEVERHFDY